MTLKRIIFAGPSIHGTNIGSTRGVDFRPPATCGDILKVLREGCDVIGIIDGGFEQGPAVWHKEILRALSEGVAVFGASSMGALRAAELADFGMVGVGQIFEDYRSGRRTSDADVALVHGPAALGWPPLSLPIVDLDAGLRQLLLSDLLSEDESFAISNTGHVQFFKTRTWKSVLDGGISDPERRKVCGEYIVQLGDSQKTRDARLLTDAVLRTEEIKFDRPNFIPTTFIRELERRLGSS